jgi:hypothetical protein
MKHPTKKKNVRSAAQLFSIARILRSLGPEWQASAGYELRELVDCEGKQWTICIKIHAISDEDLAQNPFARVDVKSSVTIWPPDLTKQEEKRLERRGLYDELERTLTKAGYKGQWQKSPHGRFADFWKGLRTADGAAREGRLVSSLAKVYSDRTGER